MEMSAGHPCAPGGHRARVAALHFPWKPWGCSSSCTVRLPGSCAAVPSSSHGMALPAQELPRNGAPGRHKCSKLNGAGRF